MSLYSGRCDVYDSLVMIHEYTEEDFKNADIYIGGTINPETFKWEGRIKLPIKNQFDAMPWYAHLISLGAFSKNGGNVIHLTTQSYPDIREAESHEIKLKHIRRAYNRLKRNKINVTEEILLEEFIKIWGKIDPKYHQEIPLLIERFMKNHSNPDLTGVKNYFCEKDRERLYEDMVIAGYTEEDARDWIWGDKKNALVGRSDS